MSARVDPDWRDWLVPAISLARHPDAGVWGWAECYRQRGWWSPTLSCALDRRIEDEELAREVLR